MEKQLFIVGKFIAETPEGPVWEFSGAYTTRDEALLNCIDRNYFIGPCNVNTPTPEETHIWPGLEYPLA